MVLLQIVSLIVVGLSALFYNIAIRRSSRDRIILSSVSKILGNNLNVQLHSSGRELRLKTSISLWQVALLVENASIVFNENEWRTQHHWFAPKSISVDRAEIIFQLPWTWFFGIGLKKTRCHFYVKGIDVSMCDSLGDPSELIHTFSLKNVETDSLLRQLRKRRIKSLTARRIQRLRAFSFFRPQKLLLQAISNFEGSIVDFSIRLPHLQRSDSDCAHVLAAEVERAVISSKMSDKSGLGTAEETEDPELARVDQIALEVVGISANLQTRRKTVHGDKVHQVLEAENRFLRRWRLSADVQNFWQSIFSQLQPSLTRDPNVFVAVNVQLNALVLETNLLLLKVAGDVTRSQSMFSLMSKLWGLRPAQSPFRRPRLWWVYAIKAVLRLAVHVRRLNRYEGLLESLVSKSSCLVEYIDIFNSLQQYKNSHFWKKILMRVSGRLRRMNRSIARLEEGLSESEIISLRRFHNHEIKQMLEESTDEIGAAPKVRLQLYATLPKLEVTLSMEGGSVLDEDLRIPEKCKLVVIIESVHVSFQPENIAINGEDMEQVPANFKLQSVEILMKDDSEDGYQATEKIFYGMPNERNYYAVYRQFSSPDSSAAKEMGQRSNWHAGKTIIRVSDKLLVVVFLSLRHFLHSSNEDISWWVSTNVFRALATIVQQKDYQVDLGIRILLSRVANQTSNKSLKKILKNAEEQLYSSSLLVEEVCLGYECSPSWFSSNGAGRKGDLELMMRKIDCRFDHKFANDKLLLPGRGSCPELRLSTAAADKSLSMSFEFSSAMIPMEDGGPLRSARGSRTAGNCTVIVPKTYLQFAAVYSYSEMYTDNVVRQSSTKIIRVPRLEAHVSPPAVKTFCEIANSITKSIQVLDTSKWPGEKQCKRPSSTPGDSNAPQNLRNEPKRSSIVNSNFASTLLVQVGSTSVSLYEESEDRHTQQAMQFLYINLGKVEVGSRSFDGQSRSLGVVCEKLQLSFPVSQSPTPISETMLHQDGVHISSLKLEHVFKGKLSFKTSTSVNEFGNRWLLGSKQNSARPIHFTSMSHFPARLLELNPFVSPSRAMSESGRAHGNFRLLLSLNWNPSTTTGSARVTMENETREPANELKVYFPPIYGIVETEAIVDLAGLIASLRQNFTIYRPESKRPAHKVKRASSSKALELDVEIRYVKLQAFQRNELIGFMVIEKIVAQRIGIHDKYTRLSVIDVFVQQVHRRRRLPVLWLGSEKNSLDIPGLETGTSHFSVRELASNSIESGLLAQMSVERCQDGTHSTTEILVQGMYIAYRHSQPFLETVIETISHMIRALHPMYDALKATEVHRSPRPVSSNKLVLQVYFASAAITIPENPIPFEESKKDSANLGHGTNNDAICLIAQPLHVDIPGAIKHGNESFAVGIELANVGGVYVTELSQAQNSESALFLQSQYIFVGIRNGLVVVDIPTADVDCREKYFSAIMYFIFENLWHRYKSQQINANAQVAQDPDRFNLSTTSSETHRGNPTARSDDYFGKAHDTRESPLQATNDTEQPSSASDEKETPPFPHESKVVSEVKVLVGIVRGELGGYREWDTNKIGSTYTMGAKNVAVTVLSFATSPEEDRKRLITVKAPTIGLFDKSIHQPPWEHLPDVPAILLPEMSEQLPNYQEFTFKSISFRVQKQEPGPKALKHLQRKESLSRCVEGNQDSYEEFWSVVEETREKSIVYINNEDLKSDHEGPVITPPDFQVQYTMKTDKSHGAQIALSHGEVHWRTGLDIPFLWELTGLFGHFYHVIIARRNYHVPIPSPWMHFNVSLSSFEVWIKSRAAEGLGVGGDGGERWATVQHHHSLRVRLPELLINFSWGGFQEQILKIVVRDGSACTFASLKDKKADDDSPVSEIDEKKDFLGPLNFTYERQGQIRKRQESAAESGASKSENMAHVSPSKRQSVQHKTVIRDTIQIDSVVIIPHLSSIYSLRELYLEQMEAALNTSYIPHDAMLVDCLSTINMKTSVVKLLLIDDFDEIDQSLVNLSMNDLEFELVSQTGHEAKALGVDRSWDMQVNTIVGASAYSSVTEELEDLLEPWEVSVHQTSYPHSSFSFNSDSRLNVLLSPSQLPTLMKLKYFAESAQGKFRPDCERSYALYDQSPSLTLKNLSGINLFVWKNFVGSSPHSGEAIGSVGEEPIPVRDNGEAKIRINEASESLNIQLEGGWKPLPSIPVLSGSLKYSIPCESIVDQSKETTLIVEISSKNRKKLLELHSPIRLINFSGRSMVIKFQLQTTNDFAIGVQGSGKFSKQVHLGPSEEVYIPMIFVANRGFMKVRAHGYDWAAQDTLEIGQNFEDLVSLQRLLTCPPQIPSDHAFHCSVHVTEDLPAVLVPSQREGIEPTKDTLETSPCFAIAFSPPLVIQNFLPDAYSLQYNFKCEPVTSKGIHKHSSSKDSHEGGRKQGETLSSSIPPGDRTTAIQTTHDAEVFEIEELGLNSPKRSKGFSQKSPSWRYEHEESGWENLEAEDSHDVHFPNLEKSAVKMYLKVIGPDDVVYTSSQPYYIHTPKESIFANPKTVVDNESDLVSKSTIPLQSVDQSASDAYELRPMIDVRKRIFGPDIILKRNGTLCMRRFATIQVEIYSQYWILNLSGVDLGIADGRPQPFGQTLPIISCFSAEADKTTSTNQTPSAVNLGLKKYRRQGSSIMRTRSTDQDSNTTQHIARPRSSSHHRNGSQAIPALFYSTDGKAKFKAEGSVWSDIVDIEKVGLSGTLLLRSYRKPKLDASTRNNKNLELEKIIELGISRQLGAGVHERTKIIIISPLFIFNNKTGFPLLISQKLNALGDFQKSNSKEKIARFDSKSEVDEKEDDLDYSKDTDALTCSVSENGTDLLLFRKDSDVVSWKIEDGQIASFNFVPTPGVNWSAKDESYPFRVLEMRPLPLSYDSEQNEQKWADSASFRIDEIGDLALRIYDKEGKEFSIWPIVVSLLQASLIVTFVPPNSFTPYKIVNKTKKVRAIIYQKDVVVSQMRAPEENRVIRLDPDGECQYSWDEPTKTKKLKMRFSILGNKIAEEREIEFDPEDISSRQMVVRYRTNSPSNAVQPSVSKVSFASNSPKATLEGHALSRNPTMGLYFVQESENNPDIEEAEGDGSDSGSVTISEAKGPYNENNVRRISKIRKLIKSDNQEMGTIYVFVVAEGATRTVTISDESKKDSQTAEDERKLMAAKIAHLDEQVAELDQHLDKYIRKNPSNTAVDSNANVEESTKAFSEESFSSSKDVRNNSNNQNGKSISPNNSVAEIVELPDNSQQLLQRTMTRRGIRHKERLNTYGREYSSVYGESAPTLRSESTNTEEWWTDLANSFRGGPEEMIVRSASKFLRTTSKFQSNSGLSRQLGDRDSQKSLDRRSSKSSQDNELIIANSGPVNENSTGNILDEGGELRVKILRAVDLDKVSENHRGSSGTSSLNPFAIVSCEGETQRTTVRSKTSNPQWSDTLVFKSVSAVSVIKVHVKSKARRFRREDRSLGFCVISLDTISEKEVTTFKLGRKEPEDIVSGSIDVLIEWNRTPLEQLALLLRNRETELRVKEQILTLLEARINDSEDTKSAGNGFAGVEGSHGTISEDGNTTELLEPGSENPKASPNKRVPKGVGVSPGSREGGKSTNRVAVEDLFDEKKVDVLLIRVMEARNLHYALEGVDDIGSKHNRAKNSKQVNSFAKIKISGKGNKLAQRTRLVQGSINPQWNQTFEFRNVSIGDVRLRVWVLQKNRIRSDTVLGKASVHLKSMFEPSSANTQAQYRWIKLETTNRNKGKAPEIRVRIQLVNSSEGKGDGGAIPPLMQSSVCYEISLSSIGITLADFFFRDTCHVFARGLNISWKAAGDEEEMRATLTEIQVDNQLQSTSHPVMVTQTVNKGYGERDVIELSWVRNTQNPSVQHFVYFAFILQELDLYVEESFLDNVVVFIKDVSLSLQDANRFDIEIRSKDTIRHRIERNGDRAKGVVRIRESFRTNLGQQNRLEIIDPIEEAKLIEPYVGASKWYFELLNLHPVKVNVTLESGQRSYSMVEIEVDRYTAIRSPNQFAFRSFVGIPTLLSIKDAPIRLDAKLIEHAFISREDLIQRLTAHYRRSGLTELYKILGSADFLGSPTSLIGNLGSGVVSFFYEPYRGFVHSPEEFGKGVAIGMKSLIAKTVYGLFSTTSSITGSLGRGFDHISPYVPKRSRRSRSVFQFEKGSGYGSTGVNAGNSAKYGRLNRAKAGVTDGFFSLVDGIESGLEGLVTQPLAGAERDGVYGFFAGIAKGLWGVAILPTAGVLKFASQTTAGLTASLDDRREKAARIRAPRVPKRSSVRLHLNNSIVRRREFALLALNTCYPKDVGKDVLHVGNVDVVISSKRILCVDTKENTFKKRWAAAFKDITSIEPKYEYLLVRHSKEKSKLRAVGMGVKRKEYLWCPTRDLQEEIIRKLRLALTEAVGSKEPTKDPTPDDSADGNSTDEYHDAESLADDHSVDD